MFDYSHLEALLAIEREGSIDGAARSLGISASAISQRIKVLEERVGAITVNRQRPAKPTEFGKLLCRHYERVMLLEQKLITDNASSFSRMTREINVICVAIDEGSMCTWFTDVMRKEQERNPAVLYNITVIDGTEARTHMKEGSALAAISTSKDPIQGCSSQTLGSQTYVAVMTPEFSQSHFAKGVDAEVIKLCATVRFSATDTLYREWLSENFGFEFELHSHIVPSCDAVLSIILKGIAWGILPKAYVQSRLKTGELIELIEGSEFQQPLYWHYSRAVKDALQPLTEAVQKVSSKKLIQKSTEAVRVLRRVSR